MTHKFVKVRKVNDHSVTAELAELSLPVWEGVWEPIPDDEDAGTVQHGPANEKPPGGTSPDEGDPKTASKTSRSRSSAASTDKE